MNKQKTSRPKRRFSCFSGCTTLFLMFICLILAADLISYSIAGGVMHRQIPGKYPPPGEMVDVGGYRLHLYCVGTDDPTVVVDVAWSASSLQWKNVQTLLSQTHRTCIFDRAGRAWSDSSPSPREIQVMTEELHTTLSNAGIESPYILIGEGEAALYARYYASQYPDELHGLGLIVPALAKPIDWAGFSRPLFLVWVLTTPFDVLTWLSSDQQRFFFVEPECVPTETCNFDNFWYYEIQNQRTTSSELNLWDENNAAVDRISSDLGDLPLIVVYPENYYEAESMQKLNALLTLSTHSTALPQDQSDVREQAPNAILNAVEWLAQ